MSQSYSQFEEQPMLDGITNIMQHSYLVHQYHAVAQISRIWENVRQAIKAECQLVTCTQSKQIWSCKGLESLSRNVLRTAAAADPQLAPCRGEQMCRSWNLFRRTRGPSACGVGVGQLRRPLHRSWEFGAQLSPLCSCTTQIHQLQLC